MATTETSGAWLYYESTGTGEIPLVLVHGSWVSHHSWDLVAPILSESYTVISYDRRGHGQSTSRPGQGSIRDDVADLAALIENLGIGPAWIVGNSFGASITLRLAGERPGLFRGLVVHEPPLFSLMAGDPAGAAMLDEIGKRIHPVVERIASGDHAGAAEQFVDTVALGPGSWEKMPSDAKQIFVDHAPTFLDEARDPEQLEIDLDSVRSFGAPALITLGDASPPVYAPVVSRLAATLPNAEVFTFKGAGHVPHLSHPSQFVYTVRSFIERESRPVK